MIYSYMHYGELPKRLKGAVSKTARRESVRGFKSLILRHPCKMPDTGHFLLFERFLYEDLYFFFPAVKI